MFLQELEATPIDRARTLMDANFWGTVTVSPEAVRFEENPRSAGGMLVCLLYTAILTYLGFVLLKSWLRKSFPLGTFRYVA
jgi:hypothetical protein